MYRFLQLIGGAVTAENYSNRNGAVDYLTKPFHNMELFARLQALLRYATGTLSATEYA